MQREHPLSSSVDDSLAPWGEMLRACVIALPSSSPSLHATATLFLI